MKNRSNETVGLLLFVLGSMILISQISYNPTEEPTISPNAAIKNIFGIFGIYTAHFTMKMFLGWGALFIPIIISAIGILIFFKIELKHYIRHFLYLALSGLLVSIWITVPLFYDTTTFVYFHNSGLIGGILGRFFHDFLGYAGLIILLTISSIVLVIEYFNFSLSKGILIVINNIVAQSEIIPEHQIQRISSG